MKPKVALIVCTVVIFFQFKLLAQHTFADWSKHITTNEQSAFNNILYDGDFIIANGYWFLSGVYEGIDLPYYTSSNALIVKTDLDGNTIWHATMVGDGYETFFDMAVDSDKNIVAVGWSSSNDTIRINGEVVYVPDMEWTSRGVVAKFSGLDGSLIWYKPILPYEEYYNMSITKVAIDAADQIYITGYSNTSFSIDGIEFPYIQNGWGTQTFIARLDPQGNAVWGHNFNFINEGEPGWSTSKALIANGDELFLALEYSKPMIVGDSILPYTGQGFNDWIAIARLSTIYAEVSGVLAYGSTMKQNLTSLKADAEGNLVVCGYFESASDFNIHGNQPLSYGYEDAYVAKFSNNLELQWLKSMGSEFASRAFNLKTAENRIFVGGGFDSYTPFYYDGHQVIDAQSPNSLGMFEVVLDAAGEFEKAFALYGEGIESRVEYRDAIRIGEDQMYAVGASIEDVSFVEGNTFSSVHDAGFFLKWDLSKSFYKVFFIITDEDGNALDQAMITLGDQSNAAGNYSFYQVEPGLYSYSISLEGYVTVQGEASIVDQNLQLSVTMFADPVSVQKNLLSAVNIFPNPASETVSIKLETIIQDLYITDNNGRIRYTQSPCSNASSIDVSALPAGLYFVHIMTQDEKIVQKLMIAKHN